MKEFVQVRMPIPILVCKRTMLSTSILVLTLNTFFHHQAALLSLDAPGGEELVLAAFSDSKDLYAGRDLALRMLLQQLQNGGGALHVGRESLTAPPLAGARAHL
eukprot:scaffold73357_cov13-Tisochrysis_lutea.AAC.1